MENSYFLANNCFACRAQTYWIILDVLQDKYLCVTHDDLCSVGDRLHGWGGRRGDLEQRSGDRDDADAIIESMIATGIITRDANEGKPFTESYFSERKQSMYVAGIIGPSKLSLVCALRFLIACAKIDCQLRMGTLARTLAKIVGRNRRRSKAVMANEPYAAALITAFRHLRPLYPRPYLCLFESLALFEFLASYGLFPTVVFGVIADPFQAHCWLQEGSCVLNDDVERVNRYTPIMAI